MPLQAPYGDFGSRKAPIFKHLKGAALPPSPKELGFRAEKMMKVRASIKADPSKGDKIVRRRGRVYVINKTDPNRKQRQKGPGRKK